MEGKYWGYHQAQPPVQGGLPTSGRLGRSWFPKDLFKCFGFSHSLFIYSFACAPGEPIHPSWWPGTTPAGEHRSRRGIDTSQAGFFRRRGALPSHLPGQQHLSQARDPAPTDRHPEVRSNSSSPHYTRWVFRTRKTLPTKRPAALSFPKGSKAPQSTARAGGAGGPLPRPLSVSRAAGSKSDCAREEP